MVIRSWKEKVKIEIGANTGRDTKQLAADGSFVFAFEPNPVLYTQLTNDFRQSPNILVLPIAIDIEDSVKEFNVSLQGDMGFGSLYNFHPDLLNTELRKHSEYNTSFAYKQNVLTMRLDTFVVSQRLEVIDYLWIDAQGNDFNCLKSLGNEITRLKAGRCETMYKVPIYDNDNANNVDDVTAWLKDKGFAVKIAYTHADDSEIDLEFWR